MIQSLAEHRELLFQISGDQDRQKNALHQFFLSDPTTPVRELAVKTGMRTSEISQQYGKMQKDQSLQEFLISQFYPHRRMIAQTRAMVRDWQADPNYARSLLGGLPVSSRDLEIHATKGNCNYGCRMCLWSDKEKLTYVSQGLKSANLMTNQDWIQTLAQAQQNGTRRAIISGGGEPLLKKDLFDLIGGIHELGLVTQLYTTGFNLDSFSVNDWKIMLQMEQIRFSVHSPDEKTYDLIVQQPESAHALARVTENISGLLARRKNSMIPVNLKIGVGFVVQPLNFDQIERMAEYSAGLGVDFFHIRKDEVDVTADLNLAQKGEVSRQLVNVRAKSIQGGYGKTEVDLSDDLIGLANGQEEETRSVPVCYMKYFRPAISPFGVVAPCDLKAEPRFALRDFNLGQLGERDYEGVLRQMPNKIIPANCQQCMPSGRTGNAIVTKLVTDYQDGINYTQQPFNL